MMMIIYCFNMDAMTAMTIFPMTLLSRLVLKETMAKSNSLLIVTTERIILWTMMMN
jgi:hypothetical protein